MIVDPMDPATRSTTCHTRCRTAAAQPISLARSGRASTPRPASSSASTQARADRPAETRAGAARASTQAPDTETRFEDPFRLASATHARRLTPPADLSLLAGSTVPTHAQLATLLVALGHRGRPPPKETAARNAMDVRHFRSITRTGRPGRSTRAHSRARVDDRPTLSSLWLRRRFLPPRPAAGTAVDARGPTNQSATRKRAGGGVSDISILRRDVMSEFALGASSLRHICSRESICSHKRVDLGRRRERGKEASWGHQTHCGAPA